MIIVFVLGYLAIAFEHPIKVDKAASALIMGGLGWGLFAFSGIDHHSLTHEIQHHIVDIAEILFFLLGAMTIVELVDAHQGFSIITDRITTNKKVYLIWILSIITFFFSAVLDNLTTAIVMAALLPKLIKNKENLWLFAGVVILSANAGGAWSPIGDVTTTMLWVGGQITSVAVITNLFIPSVVAASIPVLITVLSLKGFTVDGPANEFR
jgi:Na+/H+ antiporter NhaD/arsenite permease-like protein